MASTRVAGSSWLGGCYVYVDYAVVEQSVAGNWSDIHYSFGIHFGTSYFNTSNHVANWTSNPGTGGDDGDFSYAPFLPWPHGGVNQDYVFHTETFRVFHDATGHAKMFFTMTVNPSDFGGGGTRSVTGNFNLPNILRTSPAPSTPVISSVASTSFFVSFNDGVGGAPIDSRQIAYGTSPTNPGAQTIIASDGSTSITGLTVGTQYYVWARTHNAAGYSPWSVRATATTLAVPDAPTTPVISAVTPTSVVASFTLNGNGGSIITAVEVGYGISPVAPTDSIPAVSPQLVPDLDPGTLYYFRVRAMNAIGWGPWSPAASAMTIAGARINVGGTWKLAVPYVRVAGVWKLARPYVRYAGSWKETS